MTFHNAKRRQIAVEPVPADASALVMTVCRCAMAGFSLGDAACWDIGWQALASEMSLAQARGLFGEFHHFVRTLRLAAERPLDWRPATCSRLSSDEVRMLRMIEAAQCRDRLSLIEAAQSLVSDEVSPSLEAAQSLADALTERGLYVTSG